MTSIFKLEGKIGIAVNMVDSQLRVGGSYPHQSTLCMSVDSAKAPT